MEAFTLEHAKKYRNIFSVTQKTFLAIVICLKRLSKSLKDKDRPELATTLSDYAIVVHSRLLFHSFYTSPTFY